MLLRVFLILGLVVFGQLGYASLQLSKFSDPRANVNNTNLFWNPFSDSDLAARSELEMSMAQARQHLSFMTFPRERKQEISKVLSGLYAQINIQSFDSKLWEEVIQLQRELKPDPKVRLWSLQAGLLLGGWRKENRLRMTGGCVEEPPVLMKISSEVCAKLLNRIDKHFVYGSAALMGVRGDYLEERLVELNEIYDFSSARMESNSRQ